jgi:hypothetical protein
MPANPKRNDEKFDLGVSDWAKLYLKGGRLLYTTG